MAQRSKRAKFHARTKMENSKLRRAAGALQSELTRTVALVIMLLSKQGGEVTFTTEELNDLSPQIQFMGYKPNVDPVTGVLTVTLQVNEEAMQEAMKGAAARQAGERAAQVAGTNTPILDNDVLQKAKSIVLTDEGRG
jgi:hypothetical protein